MNPNTDIIKKLFEEKKYTEIINFIETTIKENERSAGLLNILGVSRVLSYTINKNDLNLALANFKKAYLKENKTSIGLDALINYINVSVQLFDLEEVNSITTISYKEFEEILYFFEEAKKNFGYKKNLYLSMVRVYKRLNDIEESIFYLEKIYENNDLDIFSACSYIYYKSFIYDSSQNDFLEKTKLINDNIQKIDQDKLNQLNIEKGSKIRIGFLSSDLQKNHSVTYFLKSILLNYDHNKFEINIFFNNKNQDQLDDQITKHVDSVINLYNLSDLEAINKIREKKIDIIFDLMGITSSNKISLFKNRLAPVQINWLGYCNTTGIPEMDYIIADPNLIYPDEEKLYSEKIIYLPNIWSCHVGFDFLRPKSSLPCLKNNTFNFGSFNNFNKINDTVIKAWSDILKELKNSRLILKSSTKVDQTLIKKKFDKFGVLNSVIFYDKKISHNQHMELYNHIDVALDTFPYNGVTTSFESLWMGVPVLTTRGFNFNSRCGVSINKNIGLDDYIADNIDDYILKAINLGLNFNKIEQIKEKIFEELPTSSLFDKKKFSTNFFQIMEKIYNNL